MRSLAQPVRLFYTCPMFRYDRPQAGRFRQFHQFGVEAIGDGDAAVDAEVIQLAMAVLGAMGLTDVTLVLNSIGDAADRPAYLDALREHFKPHLDKLGVDDRRRFDTNPLRLLDSKDPAAQPFLKEAPRSVDHLGGPAREHWEQLQSYLKDVGISYREDHRLVRGLDYYTRTVFEIHPKAEGAQSAICAGGRYDGLIEQLGGPATPGIGFAAGIERMILNLQSQGTEPPADSPTSVVVAYRGDSAKSRGLQLTTKLRSEGIVVILAPERSLKAQMRYASSVGASRVLILGDAELAKNVVTLRDMAAGEQREVPITDVGRELAET
jgi:histidyl-tRNA synthetase